MDDRKDNDRQHKDIEKQKCNSVEFTHGARIISYNLNEDERPDGMKVRFKVRVVSGKPAEAVNQRQAEAIKELLLWARQHRTGQQPPNPSP